MNAFGLSRSRNCDKNNVAIAPVYREAVVCKDAPVLFEGYEALNSVCPVSSLTGNRSSIYDALQMVGNEKYSRAIDALLPELPAIMSDSRLSDDDRVSMMVSRLDTGSSSENEHVREVLSSIVSDFKDSFEKSQETRVVDTSVVETPVANE